jgi:hypothetical protein
MVAHNDEDETTMLNRGLAAAAPPKAANRLELPVPKRLNLTALAEASAGLQ